MEALSSVRVPNVFGKVSWADLMPWLAGAFVVAALVGSLQRSTWRWTLLAMWSLGPAWLGLLFLLLLSSRGHAEDGVFGGAVIAIFFLPPWLLAALPGFGAGALLRRYRRYRHF